MELTQSATLCAQEKQLSYSEMCTTARMAKPLLANMAPPATQISHTARFNLSLASY